MTRANSYACSECGVPQVAMDRVEITDANVLEIHEHSTEDGAQCHRCGRRITEAHGLGQ